MNSEKQDKEAAQRGSVTHVEKTARNSVARGEMEYYNTPVAEREKKYGEATDAYQPYRAPNVGRQDVGSNDLESHQPAEPYRPNGWEGGISESTFGEKK